MSGRTSPFDRPMVYSLRRRPARLAVLLPRGPLVIDSIVFAAWSFAAFASVILLLVEWRRISTRRHVALWIAMRLHLLRDAIGRLEARFDDEVVESV